MDTFTKALFGEKSNQIPKELDWFAPLIGDWDFDYHDGYGTDSMRVVKGEWLFRRVLNGTGIEDIFICPSRETMDTNPQPDGEYGVALRMFNAACKCYDMVYACKQKMSYLRFKQEDNKLVGTMLDKPSEKWVFSKIEENTFHWQNVTVLASGEWRTNSDVYAWRRK